MAGFEVTLYGRIWVTTKGKLSEIDIDITPMSPGTILGLCQIIVRALTPKSFSSRFGNIASHLLSELRVHFICDRHHAV
jgi:hypothetical protein